MAQYIGIVIQGMVLDSKAVVIGGNEQATLQTAEQEAHKLNQNIEMEEGYTAIVLPLPNDQTGGES